MSDIHRIAQSTRVFIDLQSEFSCNEEAGRCLINNLVRVLHIPVKDVANKRRDESHSCLCTCNCLYKSKHKRNHKNIHVVLSTNPRVTI